MSFLDTLFGQTPEPYDPNDDADGEADPAEAKSLARHVDECTRRYVTLRKKIQLLAVELHATRRLLAIIIALLVMNKAIDFSVLSGLLAP